MRTVRLIRLSLNNFKGIREFTLDIQGNNAEIRGDNATGKTSIVDGFMWALFNKDSLGQTSFEIKTLDHNNEPLHGLDHSVELVLEVDGKMLTLKKTYRELWQKKRGAPKEVFTGHTTDYYINDVPVKKSEYEARISQIASEDTFRLLTDPRHFNNLHWEKRRAILLEVCGDVSDDEVIASNKELLKLREILGDRDMDDLKKLIAAKRKKINQELQTLPVRIDEASRALPDITGIDAKGLPAAIEAAKGILGKKQDELSRIQGGGEIAEKRRQLAVIEGDILRLQNEHQAEQNKAIQVKYALISEANSRAAEAQAELSRAKRRMDAIAVELEKLESSRKQLREEWRTVNDEQFEYFGETACPTCGQDLPEEKVEEAREKALKAFNLDKAKRLENINSTGRGIKANIESLMAENSDLVARANAAELNLQGNEADTVTLQVEIDALKDQTKPITDNPKYTQKLQEKENIEAAIAQLQANSEAAANAVQAEIASIRRDIESLEMDLLKVKSRAAGEKRIEELKEQEKALAAEFEKLEGELFLCDTFVKTKVSLLEEKINSKFKYARFKMFEVQINGGINECCETLFCGVPYSGGLNNAARINVGLDIINALAEHYGFNAPIWIDNREAVTRPIETVGQLISLVVSEQDTTLRVVTENKEYKEAV